MFSCLFAIFQNKLRPPKYILSLPNTNVGLDMYTFRVKAIRNSKFLFGSPCMLAHCGNLGISLSLRFYVKPSFNYLKSLTSGFDDYLQFLKAKVYYDQNS